MKRAEHPPRWAAPVLGILTVAFAARVLAQLIQRIEEVSWLPGLDVWQGSSLPYPVLLPAQIVILVVQVLVTGAIAQGRWRPAGAGAVLMFAAGFVYFATMAFRLASGLTFADEGWLDYPLPSFFHLVLASFLMVWALTGYPAQDPNQAPHWLRHAAYPAITIGACSAFYIMAKSGIHEVPAAYIPVIAGVGLIALFEWRWPYRPDWRPTLRVARPDAVFLVLVQIALPVGLAGGYALIADRLNEGGWQLRELWPHSLPATVQVVLMVLIADLFRYPLHRMMHSLPALWRFHAVHHSPDRLYWLNVGRFHPVEKLTQGVFEALPFVIVGVNHWVLAGYFVFYAVNGFFQHSNCDVQLGPLNWVISGPELHRWHHSVNSAESHTNYGNNVIVWDVLFNTRVLPRNRQVAALGNGEPDYPRSFLASMARPLLNRPLGRPLARSSQPRPPQQSP